MGWLDGDTYVVVVPRGITTTGIGIVASLSYLHLMCPKCEGELIYREQGNPWMICSNSCRATFDHFPGIPSEVLRWGEDKPYHQIYRYKTNGLEGAVPWIERWTGLTNVTIEIEG